MRYDSGTTVWCFDQALWGDCVQGQTEAQALAQFQQRFGPYDVVERITGDEGAFARDSQPASDDERSWTKTILKAQHERCLHILRTMPEEALDYDDPDQVIASYASWRTPRKVLWHIADAESRYYIPSCGLPGRPRLDDLADELETSHAYALKTIDTIDAQAQVTSDGEVWTATKLLRRLAYHERVELDIIEAMIAKWRQVSR